MRRKKHKHTRKAVGFYKLSFGFHEPFKASCAGHSCMGHSGTCA